MPEEIIPGEQEQIKENKPIVEKIPVVTRNQIQFDDAVSPNYLKVIYGVNLRGNQVGTEAYFPRKQSAINLNYADIQTEKGVIFKIESVELVNGITGNIFAVTQNDIDNGRVSNNQKVVFSSLDEVISFLLKYTGI